MEKGNAQVGVYWRGVIQVQRREGWEGTLVIVRFEVSYDFEVESNNSKFNPASFVTWNNGCPLARLATGSHLR